MNLRTILLVSAYLLSLFAMPRMGVASSTANESQLSCTPGKKLAQQGNYSAALLAWRVFAAGPSQKEWATASIRCLQSSKLATGEKQVFEWLLKAAQAGGNYARVHLALAYGGGYGTEVDFKRARELLAESSARGDEAATLILMEMDKMITNAEASVKNCSEK